ncbi:MAG: hypothetical protein KDA87_16790 [Planctomycetales bacterium]|nr:hypothetical protein [Planctomycetales bacterium]
MAASFDQLDVRRLLLGASGAVLTGIGSLAWFSEAHSEDTIMIYSSCLRIGLLLLALWLAFPQVTKLSFWKFAVTVGLLLVLAVRPRFLWTMIPVAVSLTPLMILIWMFRTAKNTPLPPSSTKKAKQPTSHRTVAHQDAQDIPNSG